MNNQDELFGKVLKMISFKISDRIVVKKKVDQAVRDTCWQTFGSATARIAHSANYKRQDAGGTFVEMFRCQSCLIETR